MYSHASYHSGCLLKYLPNKLYVASLFLLIILGDRKRIDPQISITSLVSESH